MSSSARVRDLFTTLLLTSGLLIPATSLGDSPPVDTQHDTKAIMTQHTKLPLHFEPNRGQVHNDVDFTTHGIGYQLFLTPQGMTLTLRKPEEKTTPTNAHQVRHTDKEITTAPTFRHLRLQHVGTGFNPEATLHGKNALTSHSSYLHGNDKSQ